MNKATHFYNLNYHNTTLSKKVLKYVNVDFLESKLPIMFIYVYLSNIGLLSPTYKHIIKVPLRYLKIFLIAI